MAERIRILPLIVLALAAAMGVILYWVARRGREQAHEEARRATLPAPEPKSDPAPAAASPQDPGSKILKGADQAFDAGFYPTALTFYRDFDLRYAGTETYDAQAKRVWERMSVCVIKMGKPDPTLTDYVNERNRLLEQWKPLKALVDGKRLDEAKPGLKKFLESLPARDGRRAPVEAWLGGSGEEKK